jgi:Raf kinase inhibitor-like YbhB/YbcL family protein
MQILCPAFNNGHSIPALYTCEGNDTNPPLEWIDVPSSAKSLALILDDPDVPSAVRKEKIYDHWVLYNIDPNTKSIPANCTTIGMQGKNTSGEVGYVGPCPPRQYTPTEHRYFFKLYALDQMLDLDGGATKDEVESAMDGHILYC